MIRNHLRNNVVGYLALVVALSGTSYAAVQLQAGQVKTKHLANGAVTSKKIKDGTILPTDVKGKVLGTTRVIARARFAGDQAGTAITSPVVLTGAGWTQAANEIDEFFGTATIDTPSTAQCGANELATLRVQVGSVRVLSLTLDSDDFVSPGSGTVFELPISRRGLFEPGAVTPRTLTATWTDSCSGATHFRLRSAAIDVVGVR